MVGGGSFPARLWGRVMARALAGEPAKPLPEGDVVVAENAESDGLITRILKRLSRGDEAGRKSDGGR